MVVADDASRARARGTSRARRRAGARRDGEPLERHLVRRSARSARRRRACGGPSRPASRSPSAVRASSNDRARFGRALRWVARALHAAATPSSFLCVTSVARRSRRSARAPSSSSSSSLRDARRELVVRSARGARRVPRADATCSRTRARRTLRSVTTDCCALTCSRHSAALRLGAFGLDLGVARAMLSRLVERRAAASACSCPPSASLSPMSSSSALTIASRRFAALAICSSVFFCVLLGRDERELALVRLLPRASSAAPRLGHLRSRSAWCVATWRLDLAHQSRRTRRASSRISRCSSTSSARPRRPSRR